MSIFIQETNQYDLVESCSILCKPTKFLFYMSADASIWVLILFTVDRFVAICFPLHKNSVCTTSRAKKYSLTAFMLAIFKNIHVFWTRGIEYKQTFSGAAAAFENHSVTSYPSTFTSAVQNFTLNARNVTSFMLPDLWNATMFGDHVGLGSLVLHEVPTVVAKYCGNRLGYEYFENFVRPWVVFTVVYFVPFSIIAVCNIFIVQALFVVRREHRDRAIVTSSSERSMIQMTLMCLSASLAFIVCIAPSIVLLIGR